MPDIRPVKEASEADFDVRLCAPVRLLPAEMAFRARSSPNASIKPGERLSSNVAAIRRLPWPA
jgi:hypothetical protein